ncbi:MAG: DUF3347 domain-containing protein [Bacteroidota bacterium]
MKKILLVITTALSLITLKAQNKNLSDTHLLKHYFELKDALVSSDAVTASFRITDITGAGDTKISEATKKKLTNAGKDLEKQRAAFATLSLEMYAVIKKEKLTPDTIYQAYCPMKKMYWLSKEPVIKNPYYGKMMLNCGNITETIKP